MATEPAAIIAELPDEKRPVEIKTDLPLTAFNLPSATGEDGEGYDRQVIEFLDKNLR